MVLDMGFLHTPHGDVENTYVYACRYTSYSKRDCPWNVKRNGSQVILSNTYHLWLRPGEDIVAKAGGLHKFMNYDGPMLTDSGGFQVFLWEKQERLKKKAFILKVLLMVSLYSYLQKKQSIFKTKLGADMIMSLDEMCSLSSNLWLYET